jgi:hypothetical protein
LITLSVDLKAQTKKSSSKGKSTETKKNSKSETKKDTETKSTEVKSESPSTTSTATTSNDGILKKHGPEIQKIIKNENGIIRGYDFGTPVKKIKETEDAQYVADGRDFVMYNVQVNDKEKAEIIYYLDENDNVRGFGIAFLVNSQVMTENVEATLIDDFQNYFNERYGKFKANDKGDEIWTAQDGSYTVEMGDSSEDTNTVEIEIEIFKKK